MDYDGTTVIQDKYGGSMSMEQMRNGDIVDVTFLRSKKRLTGMKLSESAWILEKVEKYNFDVLGKNAEVGGALTALGIISLFLRKEETHSLKISYVEMCYP